MPLDELFASTDYKIWKKTSLGFSYAYQNRNDISCHGTLTTLEKKCQDQKKITRYTSLLSTILLEDGLLRSHQNSTFVVSTLLSNNQG